MLIKHFENKKDARPRRKRERARPGAKPKSVAVGASEIGSYGFDNYEEFRMRQIINYYKMSNENST
jgi:hypothetical protein